MKTLTLEHHPESAARPQSGMPAPAASRPREERLVVAPVANEVVTEIASLGLPVLRERASVAWEKPAQGLHVFGFGEAARLAGPRGSDLGDVAAAVAALRSRIDLAARPAVRLFGGGRFTPGGAVSDPIWAPFGGWQFLLPALVLTIDGERVSATWTGPEGPAPSLATIESVLASPTARVAPVEPKTAPTAAQWTDAVAASVSEIRAGRYEKSVLARRDSVDGTVASPGDVLGRLAERFPRCFVFKFAVNEVAWLGASPELLVSLEQGCVRAASVAGSQRGCTGDTLLGDAKERAEHAFVVTALRESLTPLCDALEHPAEPEVMRLPNISHLYTPFAGRPKPGVGIMDLVEAVHPTPAVAGWPRADAIDAIDRLEGLDRGWYAGPIGWLDLDGHGEFAVALRSGLVAPGRATLFAGAGIVAASIPERELAETETKFGALRDAISA